MGPLLPTEFASTFSSPIVQAFVGAAFFVGVLLIVNDVRKRLFGNADTKDGTQELERVREEWRHIAAAYSELVDDLQEELERTSDDDDE